MSVVEALVARRRQPVRHTIYHTAPHPAHQLIVQLGLGQSAPHKLRFSFNPTRAVLDGWKTEVDHFMSQLPVIVEIGQCGMLTHRDPASRPGSPKLMPFEMHPRGERMIRTRVWVTGTCRSTRGGSCGLHHPILQGRSVEIELVRIKGNVDRG